MTNPRGLLRYRPVRYALGPDGALVAAAPPDQELVADHDATLYRELATLDGASDAAIVGAASRYGPLGPIARLRPTDPDAYLWLFEQEGTRQHDKLRELHRWLATAGTARIPARLAPTARMIRGFAGFDADVLTFIVRGLADPKADPGVPRPSEARVKELMLAYQAALDVSLDEVARWIAEPEALVSVPVQLEARPRLAPAAALIRALFAVDSPSAPAGLLDPQSLHSLATEVSPYALAPLFGLTDAETIAAWRTAIAELVQWAASLRDLRSLRRGSMRTTSANLADLYVFAGLPASIAHTGRSVTDPTLSRELRDLLTLRLRQIAAWPFPAGELVGTFGRALWSLWTPITATQPLRKCTWPEGCTELLPADAHGNRRYCDAHRAMADRLRMSRARGAARVTG